jgi:iron complex transport system substrate-binding protein
VRIVSLLPAATEILFALDLGDELVGVSHRCDAPGEALGVPRVTGPHGVSPGRLLEADPDLVVTGALEDRCPDPRAVRALLDDSGLDAEVLTLAPTSVEGVLNAISTVGAMTEAEDAALELVAQLRERMKAVDDVVIARREAGFDPPRLVLLEGLDPPRSVGRWVPDQVRLAGGWELLGREGAVPVRVTWADVAEMDPEMLVLLPEDLALDDAVSLWSVTPRPLSWHDLQAVRDGRVYVVDAGLFARPGPRVVDGIETLAELIDPLGCAGFAPPSSWARVS